jgi:ectoine hydroxylase-related dioxygenase (phytanoyl-CoA dioxygenase family)
VLVKEPGTPERTAFHQDLAYFHLDGTQLCTTWVPLDPVTSESGAVEFVAGSHRRPNRYRPNFFVTTMSMPDTDGEEVPEDAGTCEGERVVSFDTEPGDITVHHARTKPHHAALVEGEHLVEDACPLARPTADGNDNPG